MVDNRNEFQLENVVQNQNIAFQNQFGINPISNDHSITSNDWQRVPYCMEIRFTDTNEIARCFKFSDVRNYTSEKSYFPKYSQSLMNRPGYYFIMLSYFKEMMKHPSKYFIAEKICNPIIHSSCEGPFIEPIQFENDRVVVPVLPITIKPPFISFKDCSILKDLTD